MDQFRKTNYEANFRLKNESHEASKNFFTAAMLLNISKYQKKSFIEMLEVLFLYFDSA